MKKIRLQPFVNFIFVFTLILNHINTTDSTSFKPKVNDEICKKNCLNDGICYNQICHCVDGFIGNDCSYEIITDGYRINLFLMLIYFLLSVGLGVLLSFLVFKFFSLCCKDNIKPPNFNEEGINIIESWERK